MVLVLHPTFTADRVTEFFTAADQLNLSDRSRDKLALEGIATIVDLPEFDDEDVSAIVRIFERPPRAPNAMGNLVNQTPYAFPAKSQKRLTIAIAIAKYYEETNQQVTPEMMMWPVLKSFSTQVDAMKETTSPPDITPMKASMPMTKFLEYFDLHCNKVIGKRGCPVKHIFRPLETPPAVAPALLPGQPHSDEHGSVEGEMVARYTFDHPLCRNDSATVYSMLSNGLQGTKYHATIVRYRNINERQDSRGAYMAIKTQHAGKAVWEAQIKMSDDFIKGRKWNGQTTLTLESHIDGHRNAYVNLTEASHHIAYQLPNDRTRVTQFLDSIACQDPELLAAIAAVKKDDPGMRDSFEQTVTFISPSDPVARKKQASKRPAAEISSTFTDGALKQLGRSGVELRWYKRKEYVELTEPQKEELKGWAATQPDNRKNKANANKKAGGKKGGQKQTPGALTPGSKKFKKYVRSEVAAMKASANVWVKSKDKADDHNAIVAAIKALASTTAATTAIVGSTSARTVTIQEPTAHVKSAEDKAAEAAELQLRTILKKGKLGF